MRLKWTNLVLVMGGMLVGMIIGWLFPIPGVHALRHVAQSESPQRVIETTILFQRLCTELLPTTSLGQHYLELGHTHWGQLLRLIWYDEATAKQTWRLIDLYTPAVRALLDGKGNTVYISQEMIDELSNYLIKMESRADTKLRQIIQTERVKIPWHALVGLTAEQAWNMLQGQK